MHLSFQKHIRPLALLALLACAAAAVFAVGAAASSSAATVKIGLREYSISSTAKSVAHGKVTFVVTNKGMHEHEFVVVRTKKDAAKLLMSTGRANETGARGEVEDLAPGQTKRLTLTLPAGHYVLLCNMDDHYKKGMRRNLVVK